jgi:hypothetical protein
MTDLNLIITKPEELKTMLFQWLDEHHESRDKKEVPIQNNDHLTTRIELAAFFGVSTVTITDWMKRGMPYLKMKGRVYFQKHNVLAYMQHTGWKKRGVWMTPNA